jgi:hypothetical protein
MTALSPTAPCVLYPRLEHRTADARTLPESSPSSLGTLLALVAAVFVLVGAPARALAAVDSGPPGGCIRSARVPVAAVQSARSCRCTGPVAVALRAGAEPLPTSSATLAAEPSRARPERSWREDHASRSSEAMCAIYRRPLDGDDAHRGPQSTLDARSACFLGVSCSRRTGEKPVRTTIQGAPIGAPDKTPAEGRARPRRVLPPCRRPTRNLRSSFRLFGGHRGGRRERPTYLSRRP